MTALVLCCDGTWNSADSPRPTNVRHTAAALRGRGGQSVWYDPGVGSGRWDRVRGGALGLGLARNVQEGLEWIGRHYGQGDRIFLFGFSRGAYTARSIGGAIGMCGIPASATMAARAMTLYRRRGRLEHGDRVRIERLRDRSWPPRVDFLGVWDTVGALGVPVTWLNWIGARRHRFHDVSLGGHIRAACHALAIDEHRRHFAPAVWSSRRGGHRQAWFAGAHSDVGGGSAGRGLSDLALLWVWAHAHRAGLDLDPRAVSGLAPDFEAPPRKMSAMYRPLGRVERPMGDGETIHWSVEQRLRQVARPWRSAQRVRRALLTLPVLGTGAENELLAWAGRQ